MSRWKNVENFIDESMPKVNLYIKFKSTKLDYKHQFVEHFSNVYNCKEYIWTGFLRKGLKFVFVRKEGDVVPKNIYDPFLGGPGFTFDSKVPCDELVVNNALTIHKDDNLIYNYTKDDSYLEYRGKFRKVTLFLRIYDNTDNPSDRWVALYLK